MADLGAIGSAASNLVPNVSISTSSLGKFMLYGTIFILVVLVLGGLGFGLWVLYRWFQYNKKIDIYEDKAGNLEYIGSDKAREIKYNIYGDTVFYLKKRKRYLPRPEIKIGRNKYAYCIMPDGEWCNIKFHGTTKELREAGVTFIHPDMRAFKAGTGKIMKDRYEKKPGFIQQYLPILLPILFFVIIGIAFYFIVDRMVAFQVKLNDGATVMSVAMDKVSSVMSGLNNICSSSGYIGGG